MKQQEKNATGESKVPFLVPLFSSPSSFLSLSSPYDMQHLKDYLDLSESALKYMMRCYPEEKDEEQMRRALGRYGLTGKQQVQWISCSLATVQSKHFTSVRPELIESNWIAIRQIIVGVNI